MLLLTEYDINLKFLTYINMHLKVENGFLFFSWWIYGHWNPIVTEKNPKYTDMHRDWGTFFTFWCFFAQNLVQKSAPDVKDPINAIRVFF